MLTHGMTVKVLASEGKWETGMYCGDGKVRINSNSVVVVEKNRIKPYRRMSEDEALAQGEKKLYALHALIKRALSSLLKPDSIPRIEVDDNMPCIEIGSISVHPVPVPVETIGDFRDVQGWEVTRWVNNYGNRDEPPGLEDSQIGLSHVDHFVARLVVESIFLAHSENFWLDLGYEVGYTQMKEDEKAAKEYFGHVGNEDTGAAMGE